MRKYNNYRKRKSPKKTVEIIAAIAALLLVGCAYAGKINPQSFFPAPFMMLGFVPMLIIALLMLLFALLRQRWIAVATLVAGFLLTAPILRLYFPWNTPDMAPPEPADRNLILKVMTYNVLSFNYNDPECGTEPSASMKLILEADPDVLLMQEGGTGGISWEEIPSLKPFVTEIKLKYPYQYWGNEGLSMLSKFPFTASSIGEEQHARSPLGYNRDQTSYVARAFDLDLPTGKQLRLVDFRLQSYHLSFGKSKSVRVSPDVKLSAFERMKRSFALRSDDATTIRQAIDNSPENVIVCGDMNDVPASHVYRMIRGGDLHDAWARVGAGYARTYNRHNLCYRIDHVFYRGDVRALNAERIKGGSSDHYPVMVTFDIDKTK